MRKPDSYYVEQAQKCCKKGIKPTGKIKRGHEIKIQMTCNNKEHKPYYTTLSNIKRGCGCKGCNKMMSQKEFNNSLLDVSHGEITTDDKYMGIDKKMKFHCNRGLGHRDWISCPHNTLYGKGCPECGLLNHPSKSNSKFISELQDIHGGLISTRETYINSKIKITFHCNLCDNNWEAYPYSILEGRGCPKCASSSGERAVVAILEYNSIDYSPQFNYKIKGKTHRLDFVLKDSKGNWCVIQPDGEQHFKAFNYMGGEKEFEHRKQMDKDENKYLPALGVRVLRIPWFWFDLDNSFILLGKFLGYKLKKPSKDYMPGYKRVKEMVDEYLERGNAKSVANKYKVSRHYIYIKTKLLYGKNRTDMIKTTSSISKSGIKRKVISIDNDGNRKVYTNPGQAEKITGINNIYKCLYNKQKTAGGYKWEYVE